MDGFHTLVPVDISLIFMNYKQQQEGGSHLLKDNVSEQ